MPVLSRRGQRRPERRIADDEEDDDSSSQNRLPEYEPLSCPLTAEAKRAIADLSNSRDVHRYENHLKASIRHLGFSVVGINDAVRIRHEALARFAEKRAESQSQGVDSKTDLDSQDKPQRELDIEAHTAALDEEVPRLTAEAETALRDLIDRQTELLDEKAALADTVNYFQTLPEQAPLQRGGRTRAEANGRGGGDPDEDDNDAADESVLPPPPEYSVIDILRQQRAEKLTEYERMTAYQRYAVNNDYAAFKKLWHDAAHGDAEVSLPNAKRWFDDAGNPVMPVVSRGGGNANGEPAAAAEADDSDDDLVIAGENREYRCPLSMQLFQNPVSNNACSHTFEKAAITEFLRRSPGHRAQCPVAGCSKEITLTDVYDDPVILRKMKRALEQQRRREEEEEEREDDNSDGNGDDDEPRVVKREGRSAGRKRRKVEEIVDDDEE
ncbi:zinc-finger of the MIZ type in Nse subunit-domain-containing protein [Colletotrichum godetiae]|uniref:Zinc-finger of the MIZ type in Nse subunit-domain-containing protein n=1 Tax=Colletotrichum godetiae TaxID=1209918 RepID=A0AAJ0AW38_9PEZI|nr:zinc-finger of the MIZ type in Nse subunit-domain-containing protein [Colletotrichum godetiae]KAK1689194.1 zinc-finger of the MIZ type in Nse subunit-domain-containing protein [Colletotrichum godetiae]